MTVKECVSVCVRERVRESVTVKECVSVYEEECEGGCDCGM